MAESRRRLRSWYRIGVSFLMAAGLVAALAAVSASLHNISYANLIHGEAIAAGGVTDDARLKSALQKRLLVPDPSMLQVGPASSGPLSGMSQRSVTISNGQGQKIELKYFTTGSPDKGIIAQQYAVFDAAEPWQRADMKLLHLADHATLGPGSAPVTVVEFADFECPYCARAFSEIETLVNTTYKGKVRLIWKNYPLPVHAWAEQAAIAAECAREQSNNAFWSFAQDFYRDQNDITPQNLRDHIDQYTKAAGLDGKALNACILGDTADKRVAQDRQDAEAIKVNSTPTFLINGVMLVGLPTSNVFDYVITSQLAEAHAAK